MWRRRLAAQGLQLAGDDSTIRSAASRTAAGSVDRRREVRDKSGRADARSCGAAAAARIRRSGSPSCGPHWAMGTTGHHVLQGRRAAPVLARIGHSSRSRVSVPSGNMTMHFPLPDAGDGGAVGVGGSGWCAGRRGSGRPPGRPGPAPRSGTPPPCPEERRAPVGVEEQGDGERVVVGQVVGAGDEPALRGQVVHPAPVRSVRTHSSGLSQDAMNRYAGGSAGGLAWATRAPPLSSPSCPTTGAGGAPCGAAATAFVMDTVGDDRDDVRPPPPRPWRGGSSSPSRGVPGPRAGWPWPGVDRRGVWPGPSPWTSSRPPSPRWERATSSW